MAEGLHCDGRSYGMEFGAGLELGCPVSTSRR